MRDLNSIDPLPMNLGAKLEAPKEQPVSEVIAFEKGDHSLPAEVESQLYRELVLKPLAKDIADFINWLGEGLDDTAPLPVPVVYEYESMPYRNVFGAVSADAQPLLMDRGEPSCCIGKFDNVQKFGAALAPAGWFDGSGLID